MMALINYNLMSKLMTMSNDHKQGQWQTALTTDNDYSHWLMPMTNDNIIDHDI